VSAMSFASEVKSELCRVAVNRRCCAQAEAYGVLLFCNTYSGRELRVTTGSGPFIKRMPALFKKAFKLSFDHFPQADAEGKRSFSITDGKKLTQIAEVFGMERSAPAQHINFAVLEEPCCRMAFLRGAFLAGGSVIDPKKEYHLELVTSHLNVGREMSALMHECGFFPKTSMRKSNCVIYFKKSNWIEDFLTTIGAPVSAMDVMTAKLEKQLRGSVNRRVNCDAANVDKVVAAAQQQIEAIRRIDSAGRLEELPEKLRETARLRLEYPEYTLSELTEEFLPPVSKSALNHRLRKLVELARALG